jgi:ATP-dependent Clp protease ATP-binding subunit ClpA
MSSRVIDSNHKVLRSADQIARRFNHEYIGTDHILLALVQLGHGVAMTVLERRNIDPDRIRDEILRIVQHGPNADQVVMGWLPYTPRAQKVVEYAVDEAWSLNHNSVGTEHLLLGCLREEESVAYTVLLNLGLNLDEARKAVLWELGNTVVWVRSNDGTAGKIAREIAATGQWCGLPILADALQEAGCEDGELLEHLRRGVDHGCEARRGSGCQVLDRLLAVADEKPPKPPPEPPQRPRRWWQLWR